MAGAGELGRRQWWGTKLVEMAVGWWLLVRTELVAVIGEWGWKQWCGTKLVEVVGTEMVAVAWGMGLEAVVGD